MTALLGRASEDGLLFDGAMATYVHTLRGHHGPAGACDDLSRTAPARVRAVHDAYLEAGADIIRTNSFRAVARAHVSDAGAVCEAAARLAREAADDWSRRTPERPRFVAGALGPPDERGAGEQVRTAYRAPLRALLDGGVDVVLFETCCDPAQIAAALAAFDDASADRGHRVPVFVSVALDVSGRLAVSGAPIDDVLAVVDPAVVAALGVNCGAGPDALQEALARLRRGAAIVTCHPSAGLPDAAGRYPMRPDDFAGRMAPYAAAGLADIVGGCCGTTPAHVAALAHARRQ